MIELKIANGCAPTGRILRELLVQNGVRVGAPYLQGATGAVCWGAGYNGPLPALNRRCGQYNKLQQLRQLAAAKVATLEVSEAVPAEGYPWIARKLHHVAGRDIRVCLQPEDAELALRLGSNYFTRFVPRRTEYRVWIYRRRHLGTYEKVLAHPERQKTFGCNHANGWAFQLVQEAAVPRASVELAAAAVDSLGLDFGAADILIDRNLVPRVLEVNTAPGVEGDGRQVIQALARKIAKWERLGYPRRNGEDRRAE